MQNQLKFLYTLLCCLYIPAFWFYLIMLQTITIKKMEILSQLTIQEFNLCLNIDDIDLI